MLGRGRHRRGVEGFRGFGQLRPCDHGFGHRHHKHRCVGRNYVVTRTFTATDDCATPQRRSRPSPFRTPLHQSCSFLRITRWSVLTKSHWTTLSATDNCGNFLRLSWRRTPLQKRVQAWELHHHPHLHGDRRCWKQHHRCSGHHCPGHHEPRFTHVPGDATIECSDETSTPC